MLPFESLSRGTSGWLLYIYTRSVAINYKRLIFPFSLFNYRGLRQRDWLRLCRRKALRRGREWERVGGGPVGEKKRNELRPNKYRVPSGCRDRAHFKYFNYFSYKPRSSSLADAFDPKPLVSVTIPFDLSLSLSLSLFFFFFDSRPPNVVRLSSVIGSGRVQQTFVMGRIDTMASDKSRSRYRGV